MKTITAIEAQRGNQQRVNVHVEGRFAFSLDVLVAAKKNLTAGKILSEEELENLAREDESQRCYDAALRFLGYRPRSEVEVMRRLRKRGFGDEVANAVVRKLREQRYLDDTAFAQFWLQNRQSFNPRGSRLLKVELRQKGVDPETVKGLTEDIDEDGAAYAAAAKKSQSLTGCDFQQFRQRLGGFLQRRGFSYETTTRVVARLWRERETPEQE